MINNFTKNFAYGFIHAIMEQYTNGYTEIPGIDEAIKFTSAVREVIGEHVPDYMETVYNMLSDVDDFRAFAVCAMMANQKTIVPDIDTASYINGLTKAYLTIIKLENRPERAVQLFKNNMMHLQNAANIVAKELA